MNKTFNHLIIFLVTLFFSLSAYSQDYDVVKKGQPVPEFTIDQNGYFFNITDNEGKVVLINFFATWCGPCLKEMPFLQKDVWEKYKDNNNFKMLAIGREHSFDEVAAFKESRNLGFPVYGDEDKSIYNKFATGFIPRNYIVNEEGKIVYASVGFSEEEFEKMVGLLEQLITKGGND
ncbi:TlpA family protein disulfide reductase [Marinilabilia salmonicolor]|uniref:TlpA family protein disulfide reductase n=1 Tax=Marinilabilia salmonicolor TaxID=989 RepID=UPI00029AC377|nr:TlpA disulfide reductase family protein [Marinilabilia salmonicolor]